MEQHSRRQPALAPGRGLAAVQDAGQHIVHGHGAQQDRCAGEAAKAAEDDAASEEDDIAVLCRAQEIHQQKRGEEAEYEIQIGQSHCGAPPYAARPDLPPHRDRIRPAYGNGHIGQDFRQIHFFFSMAFL